MFQIHRILFVNKVVQIGLGIILNLDEYSKYANYNRNMCVMIIIILSTKLLKRHCGKINRNS